MSSVCFPISGSGAANLCDCVGKAYAVDVTSEEKVNEAVETIVKEFNGRLDIFIANAGIPWTQGPALDGEVAHYHKASESDGLLCSAQGAESSLSYQAMRKLTAQQVVNIDLDGTFYCAR